MKRLRIDYRHYICIALTLGILALGVFRFFDCVGRLSEGGRDLGLSVAYYFCELFGVEHGITPTVTQYPKIPFFPFGSALPDFSFPTTFAAFRQDWAAYWARWATWENVSAYLGFLGDLLFYVCMFVVCIFPFVLILYLLLKRGAKKQNNDYGKDTRLLRVFKCVTAFYAPVKAWLLSFIGFVREYKVYYKIWLVLFLLYFNAFTIILEFIAFYFYFVVSFDFSEIYV